MSNLVSFAKDELRRAGMFDKDADYGGRLGHATLRLIRAFSKEGHSGFSASRSLTLFERLARFKPLTPLTGADDEWQDVSTYGDGSPMWQNVRDSSVFKNNEKAWDIDAPGDREPITFPYSPERV